MKCETKKSYIHILLSLCQLILREYIQRQHQKKNYHEYCSSERQITKHHIIIKAQNSSQSRQAENKKNTLFFCHKSVTITTKSTTSTNFCIYLVCLFFVVCAFGATFPLSLLPSHIFWICMCFGLCVGIRNGRYKLGYCYIAAGCLTWLYFVNFCEILYHVCDVVILLDSVAFPSSRMWK